MSQSKSTLNVFENFSRCSKFSKFFILLSFFLYVFLYVFSEFRLIYLICLFLCTVWVKIPPPAVFWKFFPNGWEFLINFYNLLYDPFYTRLHFLFKYLQLWQSYIILSATTQEFSHFTRTLTLWFNFNTSWSNVISGIPQGFILGPLLFIIYINDLIDACHDSALFLYADDSKIYKYVTEYKHCLELQEDIDK